MNALDQTPHSNGMEIAVIGMAGQFPGADNINRFWDNLMKGVESISFFSPGELEALGVNAGLADNPDYVKARGILEEPGYFDSAFFDYPAGEAEMMEPQARLLHQCSYAALEDAGYNPGEFNGSIGFYVGLSANIYWQALTLLNYTGNFSESFQALQLTDKDAVNLRISYKLNLRGPSYSIRTACSTSLVAIHTACRALLLGEWSLALAGGASVAAPPRGGYLYEKGMVMSADGHCKAFDAGANGFVEGEGIGVVVLKPLDNAWKDRDSIYAVIKGSAVNNDGNRKVGYSAPGVEGQAEVIRMAQHISGVEPESIGFIETHGSGTPLGDTVEYKALKLAFNSKKQGFCAIGSVKTNIGHLDAAAGVAGFIKTVLALKHGFIPPSLNFNTPNPKIDFKNSPFYLNHHLSGWSNNGYPRRAGVSSFGIGGTNAHVVLEEWTRQPVPGAGPTAKGADQTSPLAAMKLDPLHFSREYQLILLSAKTKPALDRNTENLSLFLEENPDIYLADVSYTLSVGRKNFQHRRMIITPTADVTETADILGSRSRARGLDYTSGGEPSVIFMFPGLGAQYVNMGRELYEKEPLFKEEMDCCFEVLKSIAAYDLKGIIYPASMSDMSTGSNRSNIPGINRTEIAQIAIFIFEYALAKLLIRWGIKPMAMIGYSFGEYTAACLSGVFSLRHALELIVLRGRLMSTLPAGKMLSVPLPQEEIEPLLKGSLTVAIDNGATCIIAGSSRDAAALETEMKAKRLLCMPLPLVHASHSPVIDSIAGELEQKVRTLRLNQPGIPYISTITGTWITPQQAADPGYWVKQLRHTVRFADGIKELLKIPGAVFVEIGPGRDLYSLLGRFIETTTTTDSHPVVSLVRPSHRQVSDVCYLLENIGRLWLYGVKIDWQVFYRHQTRYRVHLPTYSFDKYKYPVHPPTDQLHTLPWQPLSPVTPAEEEDKEITIKKEKNRDTSSTPNFRENLSMPYTAPRDSMEHTLVEIWHQVFGSSQVGILDDFFDLRGDSLKAAIVINRIHKLLDIDISLADFFRNPTIQSLAQLIKNKQKSQNTPIEPAEKRDYYPLSNTQKRMFIMDQMDKKSINYNVPNAFIMEGQLDNDHLEKTFQQLIRRHEVLRTSFEIVNGKFAQRVYPRVEFKITYSEADEGQWEDIMSRFVIPFDAGSAPLMRVELVKLSTHKYLLLMDVHHIILDGYAAHIFNRDFIKLYNKETLPGLKLQYKDFAVWQQEKFPASLREKQEHYWLDQFKGKLPRAELHTDYPRPPFVNFEGASIYLRLDRQLVEQMHEVAVTCSATIFMVAFAAYNILLMRYTDEEDIIVGSSIEGRSYSGMEQVGGAFVGTVALRTQPRSAKTYKQYLAEVKEITLKAYDNQEYQFDDLLEKLNLEMDMSRNPLFDTMFVSAVGELEADSYRQDIVSDNLKIQTYTVENRGSKVDLLFEIIPLRQDINMEIQYATALFKKSTVERMKSDYIHILEQVTANLEIKLGDIALSHRLLSAKSQLPAIEL
jgi:phthiocerol/phenolphthiocerol synthesis type-I polyketide synthase E